MTIGSLFKAQALAGLGLIVLGSNASVMAQQVSPSNDLARCRQLYSTYNHYNGNASYTRSAQVDTAMAECEKGNYASGITDLTTALNHAAIPVPPVEAAQAK